MSVQQIPGTPAPLSRRRLLLTATTSVAMLGLLAACGSGAAATGTNASTASAATATAASSSQAASRASSVAATSTSSPAAVASSSAAATGQAVTLGWTSWATGPNAALTQSQADAFSKLHPAIKIDMANVQCCTAYYNKLQANLAAGSAPDVYRVNPVNYAVYALKGAAKVLDPLVAQAGADSFAKKMYPNVVDAARLNGKLYGVPMGGDTCCLHVNETLFKNAGVALPPSSWTDTSWTWDRFVQVATQLTKRTGSSVDQYGLAPTSWQLSGPLGSAITMNGGSMIDPTMTKVTLGDSPAVTAIQWVADLANVHHVYPTSAEVKAFNFATSGKAAMYWHFGSSQVLGLTKSIAGKFDYNIYPLPHPAGGTPHGYYHQSYWLVAASTKHVDQAWQFANFLGSEAGQKPELAAGFTVPMMPGVDSAFLTQYPTIHKTVISDAIKIAVPWRFPAGYTQASDVATKAIAPVLAGTQSASTAMAGAVPAMQNALDKPAG